MFRKHIFRICLLCFPYFCHCTAENLNNNINAYVCIKYVSLLSTNDSKNSDVWRCWRCFLTLLLNIREFLHHFKFVGILRYFSKEDQDFYTETLEKVLFFTSLFHNILLKFAKLHYEILWRVSQFNYILMYLCYMNCIF